MSHGWHKAKKRTFQTFDRRLLRHDFSPSSRPQDNTLILKCNLWLKKSIKATQNAPPFTHKMPFRTLFVSCLWTEQLVCSSWSRVSEVCVSQRKCVSSCGWWSFITGWNWICVQKDSLFLKPLRENLHLILQSVQASCLLCVMQLPFCSYLLFTCFCFEIGVVKGYLTSDL